MPRYRKTFFSLAEFEARFQLGISMPELSEADSAAIRVCRVICIFLMMSVHLVPGPTNPSFLTTGAFAPLGEIWIFYFGRASVATLSLVSGFLLAGALSTGRMVDLLRNRACTLIVPMATWNLITIVAILLAGITGIAATGGNSLPQFATPMNFVNGVFALTGESADRSLLFLRDLFVSSVLIAFCWPFISRWPLIALGLSLVLAVVPNVSEPLLFRPTILLFMLAGCALRIRGIALSDLARPRIAVPALLVSGLITFQITQLDHSATVFGDVSQMAGNVANIAKRAALVFLVLVVACPIGKTMLQRFFDQLEPAAYLAYLSHALLAKLIWFAMFMAGARLAEASYTIYFFLAPVAVFGLAHLARPFIDRLPRMGAIMLAGKARRRPVVQQSSRTESMGRSGSFHVAVAAAQGDCGSCDTLTTAPFAAGFRNARPEDDTERP